MNKETIIKLIRAYVTTVENYSAILKIVGSEEGVVNDQLLIELEAIPEAILKEYNIYEDYKLVDEFWDMITEDDIDIEELADWVISNKQ